MSYRLDIVIQGESDEKRNMDVADDRPLIIGRKKPADIVIPLPEVSGRHAEIVFDASLGKFAVQDLNSKLGTYIGKDKLPPEELRPLEFGEVFQVGRAFMKVEENGADQAVDDVEEDAEQTSFNTSAVDETTFQSDDGGGATQLGMDLEDLAKIKAAAKASEGGDARANSYAANLSAEVQEILIKRVDLAKVVRESADDQQARRVVREQIGYVVNELFRNGRIKENEVSTVEKNAFDDILGFGPLQDLLDDSSISEVMVNRANQIYYEKDGKLMLTERSFLNDTHVQQILRRLLKNSQRRIDESNPTVNATLEDGSRLHAVVPPIALDGTKITIRKFHRNLPVSKLVEFGALSQSMAKFLELATRERQNIIVSGGTGSGKTTLLNGLSTFIPEDQRLITIEDTAELQLTQPHVVRMQSRPSNAEGVGLVTIRDLVVEALRMRPDRIVVGECRHAEALDMLQAMNTGHDGSLTTVHSNTAVDALHRLETMVLLSGLELPMGAIREQVRSAVNLIVHASRLVDGSRRVTEIIEITGLDDGHIVTQPVYQFVQTGSDEEGRIIGQHEPTGYIPSFLNEMRQKGKEIPPDLFAV